jgi:hypothetical protein
LWFLKLKHLVIAAIMVAVWATTSFAQTAHEAHPKYVKVDPINAPTGSYLIGGKVPHGPMACEHIRIVQGQSAQVVRWEDQNFAATNVYFHVHKAIRFYQRLSQLSGERIYQENKPITVRLDMDVDWARWIKFSKKERFNSSGTFPDADPDKWGTADEEREIWFFVPRRERYSKWLWPTHVPWLRDTVVGTRGFPMDSARVPTVIYHEWTHLMTRPHLGIDDTTVLNEAYSDYFAASMVGYPEVGSAGSYSSFPYVRNFDHLLLPFDYSDNFDEQAQWVVILFWSLRRSYGAERADRIIWGALRSLHPQNGPYALKKALAQAAVSILTEDEIGLLGKKLAYLFK